MPFAFLPIAAVLALTGAAYLLALLILVISRAPLGSPLFFTTAGTLGIAYVVIMARVWTAAALERRLLYAAFALAVTFRIPVALAPAGPDNDMVRYLWDGRVQRLGYNPYWVRPSDPSMAHTHTVETAQMPSLRTRTPYQPAAQLFFRAVVTIHDSVRAMKLALVACDLITMVVLWRWLVLTGRNEWLTLAYAWSPLVVLEAAHSGHIDTLGAMWITASAYWLTRRRTGFAAAAFILASATKLIPMVLAPLYVGRIRVRDGVLAAGLLAGLYLPFISGKGPTLGAVPNVVGYIRFNGPIFESMASTTTPIAAAAWALIAGLSVAAVARCKVPESDPVGWAWPMAVALLCAPVVYPWYLLCLTPFLFTRPNLPLLAWSFSVLSTYVVWHLARSGGRWSVPLAIQVFEYGIVICTGAAVMMASTGRAKKDAASG
jgi:alpha-1,6-mannosyltransferase